MSVTKCMLLVSAAMCVQAVWVEYEGAVGMSTDALLKRQHVSTAEDLSGCQTVAEELGYTAILHKESDPQLCVVFTDDEATVHATYDDSMTGYTVAYYYETLDEDEDSGLSAGEIVATIILCIFYIACLVVLAFTCKHHAGDIAGQMDMLEKRELDIAEAVSEHFERKSAEYEKKSQEIEAKEMAAIEKADAQ